MVKLRVTLSAFETLRAVRPAALQAKDRKALMEFHIRREVREEYGIESSLFSLTGNVVLADTREVRLFAQRLNANVDAANAPERFVRPAQLNAMGLIDEILHYMVALYRQQAQPDVFQTALDRIAGKIGDGKTEDLLEGFCAMFPPRDVYDGITDISGYINSSDGGESCRCLSLEELLLLALANLNPAFKPFLFMFDDSDLAHETAYPVAIEELKAHFAELPPFGPDNLNLWDLLRAPALACPDSLEGQLDFMRKQWGLVLGKYMGRLLTGLDIIREEEKPSFSGPGPSQVLSFGGFENEYERFTPDQEWMPRTVLMAKCTLVWLFQLSQKYGRPINRLDEIPDEELDELSRRGFTGLWLIGVWERSQASKTIKQWTGNPEAAASAYSLYDYDIAGALGGWGALANLRSRCMQRGIRLGSDMVPNHTGIDSRWVIEHPDRFLQLPYTPFPGYTYSCENLSGRGDVTVQIEDHYFSRSDAAVVFKRIDNQTGHTRYIYHGNDGTSMPWNDTAQIDFLNSEAREAVIRTIVGVCQQFPIVRFDAAMTLAKRHIQRLWYPAPGHGGAIASRAEHALSQEDFNRRIPDEFWREVVDRCAVEAPYTLLLAEAFWMMEGYFVRTLGMHRVYNSAFMNMLKNEENDKYRATIKNTLEFDPEILKRFVNFMNNPDEETAVAQFGKGDKYFGICTLLVTMPGLPMFGHGQIEGFEEKYGMEYNRAYKDETPDWYMVDRHEREIFPLMKRRHVFSGSADFCLYDFLGQDGNVNENVFAYSNRAGDERTLVFFNNSFDRTSGWIYRGAVPIPQKDGRSRQDSLCQSLGLNGDDRFFVVLREQRSGLWYIRSSKEIAERGLFAVLNGYEAQVFLDIHQKEDAENALPQTWESRWSLLNHHLNGSGVKNLEEAALDILLGELYAPFREILSKPRMETLAGFFAAHTQHAHAQQQLPGSAEFVESFKEPVIAFVTAAKKYLDGAGGKYGAWKGIDVKDNSDSKTAPPAKKARRGTSSASGDSENPEKVWEDWSANLKKFTEKFIKKFAPKKPAENTDLSELAVLALGYHALSLLKSVAACGGELAGLAAHWQLDRVTRECWESGGISGGEIQRAADIAIAVLARANSQACEVDSKAKTPGDIAAAIVLENYDESDFRKILGVNRFDDVTWFNKEAFETCLRLVPFFASLESTSIAHGKTITAVTAAFRAAQELSGYRLDKLPEALAGKG